VDLLLVAKLATFVAVLLMAATLDVRYRRIPNGVTVGGMAAGLALGALVEGGWPGMALAGACAGLLVSFPLFAFGIVGAGDAKLFAAVGAFLGPWALLPTALYGGLAGGVLAIAGATRRGVILPVLLGCKDLAVFILTLGRHGARPTPATTGAGTVPFGVAIATGALAAWFFPLLPGGGP
jgi:prepilin peptidase CpaA